MSKEDILEILADVYRVHISRKNVFSRRADGIPLICRCACISPPLAQKYMLYNDILTSCNVGVPNVSSPYFYQFLIRSVGTETRFNFHRSNGCFMHDATSRIVASTTEQKGDFRRDHFTSFVALPRDCQQCDKPPAIYRFAMIHNTNNSRLYLKGNLFDDEALRF